MSRIKELKSHPDHNINVVDMLSLVLNDPKAAYLETLLRLMKNSKDYEKINTELRDHFLFTYGLSRKQVMDIPDFKLNFYFKFLDTAFLTEDIKTFKRFCELCERNLITNSDLTTYSSFDQISQAVGAAELKLDMRELEKQTIKIYEDDEYLAVKPLTYLSSKKYGSNTKWCTTSYEYFKRYSTNGILIYIINKLSGKKCACFYSLLAHEKEFSFWDQKDKKVDSIECDLPDDIINTIKNEVTNVRKSNRSYLTNEQTQKEDSLYSMNELKSHVTNDGDGMSMDMATPVPQEADMGRGGMVEHNGGGDEMMAMRNGEGI